MNSESISLESQVMQYILGKWISKPLHAATKLGIPGIGTSFLLKKVSKIPKVKNITVPLIQAQHVVLVSGERILSQGKNQSPKI
tara:strand:- start:1668 stop:1919 length:252 start_codon:yes stop_codon:yes gene_type:complete